MTSLYTAFEQVTRRNLQLDKARLPVSLLVTLTNTSKGAVVGEVNYAVEPFLLSLKQVPTLAE